MSRQRIAAVVMFGALWISGTSARAEPPPSSASENARTLTGRVLDARTGETDSGRADCHAVPCQTGSDLRFERRVSPRVGFDARAGADRVAAGLRAAAPARRRGRSGAVAEFRLEPRAFPMPEIEVTTTRATDRGSAVAFSELDRPAIQEHYWAQDTPMLLAETPGVYAYSDAGNGVGYSYVKIRGFSQRRVAVTVNGIPLNDPESHEVYWVDHPDLASSAQTLQVQRGVGNALYGASAVGGSINFETLTAPGDRSISLEVGGGTYDTQRLRGPVPIGAPRRRLLHRGTPFSHFERRLPRAIVVQPLVLLLLRLPARLLDHHPAEPLRRAGAAPPGLLRGRPVLSGRPDHRRTPIRTAASIRSRGATKPTISSSPTSS